MADLGTAGFTVISPDEAAKLIAAKKPASGVKTISASEAGRLMASKKSAAIPDASTMTQAQAVQQFEGGGLQAPAVDPIDVAMFAGTGGAYGLGKEGLSAGVKLAADEAASVAGGEGFQKSMEPIIQQIPGKGAAGNIARGAASIVTGAVPFIAAGGVGPATGGAVGKLGGEGAIGEQGAKAGAKAGAEAESAQTEMAAQEAKAKADLDTKYEKFRQQQIPGAKDEARTETIQRTIGPTSSSTMEQGPERIARNEQFRESTTAPLERWRSDWADRRNKLLESRKDTVVDDGPLQTAVTADEAKWQQGARPYSPAAQRLIDKVKGLGTEPGPLSDLFTDEEWAKMTPTQRANYLKSAGRTESPAKMTSYKEGVAPPVNAAGQTRTRPKVPELIGLQSEANSLARSSKGADRTLALKVVHGIDDSLAGADIDVPAYKKIQAEYRDHRLHFPYSFEDAVQGTARPVDTANQIFSEPERALDLANLSNPEEKGNLRQLWGQYVNENGTKVVTKDQQPFLAKLYPSSPLSKPEAWIYLDKGEQKLSDVLEHAPGARQKFFTSLENQRQDLLAQNSKEGLKLAKQWTDSLGNTGERMWAKIQAGKTPEEQAKIAYQEFGALNPTEEGQAAGVKAIQNASAPEPGGLVGQLRRRATIYAVLALSGRPFFERMGILLGVPTAIHEVIRNRVLSSLRDPGNATQLYRSILEPGAKNSLDTISRNIIMGALPAETAQVGQAITAKPKGPGPMVKQVEHEKAVNIAGPRGAVSPARTSRIEDLNKDIAQGNEPEVHADLRNGRLTHTDLAKMVQPDKPGVAGLFQGMSPTQAVDAFAVADKSEREMAMPALAQHLQDSAKTTDPKQMAIAMQKLKSIMAQQGATA